MHLTQKRKDYRRKGKHLLRMSTHPFEPNKKNFFTHKQKNKKTKSNTKTNKQINKQTKTKQTNKRTQ
jgi:hypothetical protein